MIEPWIYELVGYVASALVAISLMMSSILRLRIINLMGATTFAVYGFLIAAYPVAAVNLFIVLINLYYLHGMLRTPEFFRLLVETPDSPYLRDFLTFYEEEIQRFLPGFSHSPSSEHLVLFILRDMVPAGLFMGEVDGTTLRAHLDFVIPQYRDFKIGRYLFVEQAEFFRARGITEILSGPGNREHTAYLRKMGFHPVGAGAGRPAGEGAGRPAGEGAADGTGEGELYRLSLA
jgi:GNAT superfamily N-acetyltransferase